MKRAGFTMIELIFVIVILGILAAVALPKMAGVQEQARAAKAGELVAQLNSVIVPNIWGKAQIIGTGKVADVAAGDAELDDFMEIPSNFTEVDYSLEAIGGNANCQADDNASNAACVVMSDTTNSLYIHFRDGNATEAPRFWYTQKTGGDLGGASDYNISKASF